MGSSVAEGEYMEEVMQADATVITYTDYNAYKAELDGELERSAESFIRIGYLLKVARDTGILEASGYANVNEFAEKEYSLDKTQVSRFIRINDRFSANGYSEHLKTEYKGFGYAKMALMLQIPDSINEELTPDYSKSEIQAIKDEIDAEAKVSDIEVMLEEKDEVQQSLEKMLVKVAYQIGKEESTLYCALWESRIERDEDVQAFTEILAPSGNKAFSVRIPGIGRMLLLIKEEKDEITLINIRDSSDKRTYTKNEVMEAFQLIFLEGSAKESWESTYGETFPEEKEEVAPVQPRKESKVVKAKPVQKKEEKKGEKKKELQVQQSKEMTLHDVEKQIPEPEPKKLEEEQEEHFVDVNKTMESEEQIPGQDSIENHPEYMPNETWEELQRRVGEIIEMSLQVSAEYWKGKRMPLDVIRKNMDNTKYIFELFEKMEKIAIHEEKENEV